LKIVFYQKKGGNVMVMVAIIFINLACLFYTIGVWSEKFQKILKPWHMVVFWLGFVCDTIGTGAMGERAGGIFQLNFHGITGMSAILLMLFHAVWATIVIVKNNEKMKLDFHKFSIVVWIIWLVPMVSGMVFGTTR
jgi:uncharacterized repeat protein (TIGR03987 family)